MLRRSLWLKFPSSTSIHGSRSFEEVGATAAAFPSSKHLASWMGACPGSEESSGTNYSHRCPKGNRQMRRVLNQAANAAVKAKGTIFAIVYRRLVPRLPHANAIGAVANRLSRLIWKLLHEGIRYEERYRIELLSRTATA